MRSSEYADMRRKVIEASLMAKATGLIRGTSGNVSLRSADGRVIAITPSGIPYDRLSEEDVPLVSLEGDILDARNKPSSELLMHLAAYGARCDCQAVVHTHSVFATAYGMTGKTLEPATVPHLACCRAPLRVAPFALPGTKELAEAAVKGLGDTAKAVYLENHGLLAIGTDLDDAYECAEYAEEAAQIACYALMMHCLKPIPEEARGPLLKIMETRKV